MDSPHARSTFCSDCALQRNTSVAADWERQTNQGRKGSMEPEFAVLVSRTGFPLHARQFGLRFVDRKSIDQLFHSNERLFDGVDRALPG